MGRVDEFTPEKLTAGILTSRPELAGRITGRLSELFGPIDYQSPLLEFRFTSYYDEEMGRPIVRFFVSFERLVQPESLAAVKTATNALETEFAENGRRKVNIDPGLLTLSRFVLATTKENAHRIPLSDGIYADLTLLYRRKEFQPFEWTYPDFRSPGYHSILGKIREIYKEQLKQGPGLPRF
jgi:hypothetical protein